MTKNKSMTPQKVDPLVLEGREILRIEYVLVDDLVLLEGNAKFHDLQKIVLSILINGFLDPPKWDSNLNNGAGGIVEGNGRSEALKWLQDTWMQWLKTKVIPESIVADLKAVGAVLTIDEQGNWIPPEGLAIAKDGRWVAPVIFGCDAKSEAAAKRYSIDHNSLVMSGSNFTVLDISRLYEPEGYLEMLLELNQQNELPLTVDGDDLDLLLQQLNGEGSIGGEPQEENEEEVADLIDRAESGQIESRVSANQVWRLDRHFICCADSTKEENVRRLMTIAGVDRIDMCWSDSPYGVKERTNRKSAGRGKLAECNDFAPIIGDEDTSIAQIAFNLYTSIFPKAIHIWWGANYFPEVLPSMPSWIVWDKRDGVASDDNADCELAWSNYGKPARVFRHLWKGMIKASERDERRVHPSQKPSALPEYCFAQWGKPSDVIIDPFWGSGISTLAAQKIEGERKVLAFELSPSYCEVGIRRWEYFTGQTAQIVSSV